MGNSAEHLLPGGAVKMRLPASTKAVPRWWAENGWD
jgi:hypothetical protein